MKIIPQFMRSAICPFAVAATLLLSVSTHAQTLGEANEMRLIGQIAAVTSEGYARPVVSGNYAFLAARRTGVYVVDVSDYSNPKLGAFIPLSGAYDLALGSNYVYVARGYSGFSVIDISNPISPAVVASYSTSGFVHGITFSNNKVYLARGWMGLEIVDVSNPANPRRLSTLSSSGWQLDLAVTNGMAYIVEGLVDGYSFRGLNIVNISNSSSPFTVGRCPLPASTVIPYPENGFLDVCNG